MKLLLLLTSCLLFMSMFSTCDRRIGMRTQSAQFISSETVGERFMGEGTFFNNAGTFSEVKMNEDGVNEELKLTENSDYTSPVDLFGGNIDMGILSNLDLIIQITGERHPLMYGLKYQVLGSPRTQAKKGGHSVAIVGLIGSGSQSQENDDGIELTARDEEASIDTKWNASKAGVVYGFRASDNALLYLGGSYSTSHFSGNVESDNSTVDGVKIDQSGNYIGAQIGVMLDLGDLITLKFEGSHQKLNWENKDAMSFNYLAMGLGFNWY